MKKNFLNFAIKTAFTGCALWLLITPRSVFAKEAEEGRYLEDTDFVQEIAQSDSFDLGQNEVVGLNLEDDIYFKGALSSESDLNISADDITAEKVDNDLKDAVDNLETCIDISEYGITLEDADSITKLLLNENPGFFYVEDVCVSYDADTMVADEVYVSYSKNVSEQKDTYEHVIEKVVAEIDPSWSDELKLMYLHDYMVTHCCFDFSDDSMKYTAYKALVEGTAVCQGYSLAYQDLAERLGLQVEFVVSDKLNHGWNLVEIDGKHYYVDCTWDDALGTTAEGTRYYWYDQCCLHTYFLKSQDYFDEYHGSNKNHYADDYTIYTDNGPVKIRDYYNNKDYDNADWTGSYSPVAIVGKKAYYLKTDGNIYRYNGINNNPTKIVKISNEYPLFNGGARYMQTFGSLVSVSDYLFVNEYDRIYYVDLTDKSLNQAYVLSSSERATGYIYGMKANGSVLYCDLATNYRSLDYTGQCSFDAKDIVGKIVSSIKLNVNSATLSYAGQQLELKATVTPSGLGVDSWTSSNPAVAKVNSSGVVTAVKNGTATITAKAGKKVALCDVTVQLPSVCITKITFPNENVEIRQGEKMKLQPTYYPANAEDIPYVVWMSSNPEICSVSAKGVITAHKSGKVTITVKNPNGKVSARCSVTVNMRFDPPVLTLKTGMNGISVKWDANEEAAKYRVYRKKSGDSSWTALGYVTTNSYKDKTAEFSATYLYTVRLISADGNYLCAYGNGNEIKYRISAPKITLENTDAGIKLNWSEFAKAAKYRVYVKEEGSGWVKIAEVSDGTTYTDSNVQSGKQYTYTVVGVDAKSHVMNDKGDGVSIERKYALVNIGLSGTSSGVEITCESFEGAEKYRVYRKDPSGKWAKIGTIYVGLSYVDTTAVPNAENTYTVVAVSSENVAISEQGSGKSILFRIAPTNVATESKNSGVRLTWEPVYAAARYQIYRKTKTTAWTKVGATSGLSYIDKSAESGKNYFYSVLAYDTNGNILNEYGEGISVKYRKPVAGDAILKETPIAVIEGSDLSDAIEKESDIVEEKSEEITEESEQILEEESEPESEETLHEDEEVVPENEEAEENSESVQTDEEKIEDIQEEIKENNPEQGDSVSETSEEVTNEESVNEEVINAESNFTEKKGEMGEITKGEKTEIL